MKAAVLTAFRRPLEISELPDPHAGPGEAVIKVEACGICRSDWHLWQGDWTWAGLEVQLPVVMGHEIAGVVHEIGPAVTRFKCGDRVTVPFHLACGRCEFCGTGHSNVCYALGFLGVHRGGGYGEYAVVPNADVNLIALPAALQPSTAASLGCRYMTAYHGLVDKAAVRPGEWVAVFGAGGVGLSAVQIAAALGAQVIAVDPDPLKLDRARAEGAVHVFAPADATPAAIRDVTAGGAHVSVDALGAKDTTVPAVLSLRKLGRHLQLGLTSRQDSGHIALPVDAMLFQELSFISSLGCPTTSYPGLLSLLTTGRLHPERVVSATIAIDEVNEVLERMSHYRTSGFHVLTSWVPAGFAAAV